MNNSRLKFIIVIPILFAVTLAAQNQTDFTQFYIAGGAVLHGVNPYTNSGYFNPIYIAALFAPLSLLPPQIAAHIDSAVIFVLYLWAAYRLFGTDRLLLAMLAPFAVLIAAWGNIDALVLLGATLPAPVGVWLLLAKPQIGLFAALIMLWNYRSVKLALAVIAVMLLSVLLGMIHGGLNTLGSMSLGLIGWFMGLPLLYLAWRRKDSVIALGAAAFISPYVTPLNWCAALPLFKARRWLMIVGVALSWSIFLIWRFR